MSLDSLIPFKSIERFAKQLARTGLPISANTLFDRFLGAARLVSRLYDRWARTLLMDTLP